MVLNCNHPRFTQFRGTDLDASRSRLAIGKSLATEKCGACHLAPQPESMSQDNAAYMLAYMGLFMGIDASSRLDDVERAQFKQRFEYLKRTQAISPKPLATADEWKSISAYYLSQARYPFESSENSTALVAKPVPFDDQGVTMLIPLSGKRFAVGGGVTNNFTVLDAALKPDFSTKLDSPPVHVEEGDGGYFVLTLGSLLGDLNDSSQAALYFIHPPTKKVRKIISGLERSAHFITADVNGDGRRDFIVASFGSVTGGSVLLFESKGDGFNKRVLSHRGSIVRLALVATTKDRTEFLALAGGAREALLYLTLSRSAVEERTLIEYAPHLGSVWLAYADITGDEKKEVLVLSGDNADSGPYNEVKPDQGLRIYSLTNGVLKQVRFESLPGALTFALTPDKKIAVARFYAGPDKKQDLTLIDPGSWQRRHFTLPSRPVVLAPIGSTQFLIGAGNIPLLSRESVRKFDGPALFVVSSP